MVFTEILGWIVQFIYFSYYGILNYLLKELNAAAVKDSSQEANSEKVDLRHE